jgi:MFS family permease
MRSNALVPPLSTTARRLLAARFWRSIAQGTLVVDLALYLHALHWSGAAIGGVLSGAGFIGAILGVLVGVSSDRFGRKPFLLAYEALCCGCGLLAFSTSRTGPLTAAILLAGFGRGANGAAGPFAPAEQAWLAEAVESQTRGVAFSLNSAFGFVGMAVGAMLAMLAPTWTRSLGVAASYRSLFLIVVAGNLANFVVLWRTEEHPRPLVQPGNREADSLARETRGHENRFLRRLFALNVFNGMAVGLTGPLMSYWFARRFHVGPTLIAPVMAATFLVTAAAAWFSGGLTRRSGMVNVVLWGRGGGLAMLVLLPLMPVYPLAALLHLLRSAFNRGTIGARQALVVSAVQRERRGFAVSLNTFSARIPQAIAPAIGGGLMGAGWLALPFYLAAALQGIYLLLYGRLFHPVERALKRDRRD